MIRTIEATVDEKGGIHLLVPITLPRSKRAFVMILDEAPPPEVHKTARMSEQALAVDWNRPEEEAAWSTLQKA